MKQTLYRTFSFVYGCSVSLYSVALAHFNTELNTTVNSPSPSPSRPPTNMLSVEASELITVYWSLIHMKASYLIVSVCRVLSVSNVTVLV